MREFYRRVILYPWRLLVTQCGFILLVGQVLTVLKAKWMLLGAIFFFELGSLICGVAKDMNTLIGGRAIQGIGALFGNLALESLLMFIPRGFRNVRIYSCRHCRCHSSRSASGLYGFFWLCLCHIVCGRSSARRRIHGQRDLEVSILVQLGKVATSSLCADGVSTSIFSSGALLLPLSSSFCLLEIPNTPKLLPIAQSLVNSDVWIGSARVSSFAPSHAFCWLLHGVETNTRGTVSTNFWEPGANVSRLENTFSLYFGRLACYCIWHVAVVVRQICSHSTFSSQEPNSHCKFWRHILLHACNVGRYLPATLVLSSCRSGDTLRGYVGIDCS